MASLIGALGVASMMSSLIDRPYRTALSLAAGACVYASMKGPGIAQDIKTLRDKLDMMGEQFKRSLVIAFTTPIVLSTLTWNAICHAFCSFLASIGLIPLTAYGIVSSGLVAIGKYCNALADQVVDSVSIQQPVMIGHSPTDSDPSRAVGSALGLIFTLFTTAFAVKSSMPSNMTQWIDATCSSILWNGTKFQAVSTFFSAIVTAIRGMVDWAIGKLSRASLSARISTNHPEIIDAWLAEVDILTHPDNEDDIFSSPQWLKRVIECSELGDLIFRDVIKERPLRFPLPGLMKRYGDLKRLRDKAISWSTATSVRKEPFCVWLEGASGVGKSQVSNEVGFAIAKSTRAIVKGNPIYDIQPGTKFWSGCQGCVIARFDDFSILRGDRNTDDLSNFMRLKSPAIFISEQAEIEDKGKPWAPVGIVVNSNLPYPVPNEVLTHEAFYRRRDAMYRVEYLPEFVAAYPDLKARPFSDPEVREAFQKLIPNFSKENFDHLTFRRYRNPGDPKSTTHEPMGYKDFIADIQRSSKQYSRDQDELYLRALDSIAKLTSQHEVDMPLSAHIDRIKKTSAEILVNFADEREKHPFLYWSITIATDLWNSAVYDSVSRIRADAFKAAFSTIKDVFTSTTGKEPEVDPDMVGQSLMSEAAAFSPDALRGQAIRNYVGSKLLAEVRPRKEGPHGSACMCACDFTRATLRKCRHVSEMNVMSSDPKGWALNFADRCFENGVIKYPLICGGNCVFSVAGIQSCLQANKSWVTDTDWIHVEEEVPPTTINQRLYDWVSTTTGTILTAIYNVLTSVAFYVVVILAMGGYFLYRAFSDKKKPASIADKIPDPVKFRKLPPETEGHIANSGDSKTSKLSRSVSSGVTLKTFKPVSKVAQGPNTIHHLVRNNIIWLQFMRDEVALGNPMRCYGVAGFYVVSLKHYWHGANNNLATHVRVVRTDKKGAVTDVTCAISAIKHLHSDDTEYEIVELPPQVTTAFPDIRHHFGSVEKFEKAYYPRTAEIYHQQPSHSDIVKVYVDYPITSSPVLTESGYQTSVVSRPIRYNWGSPGQCMSVLLGFIGGRQFILGFHVAGSHNRDLLIGMTEPMFVEQLAALEPGPCTREEPPTELTGQNDASICIDAHVMPICTLKKTCPQAKKSRIIPSALQPLLEDPPRTSQAPLTRRDVPDQAFDPMEESLKPHGLPAMACPVDLYERAHEDYTEMILTHCKPVHNISRVLTENESIEGIPEIGFKSLELSTSEGFPFVFYRTGTSQQNKRWLIERDVVDGRNACLGIHPLLREVLDRKQQLREDGLIPFTAFVDCLKDARIPIYKLSKPGATRVISVSPVDYTIQFRQYFGAFISAFRYNRLQLEHAIGINVQGIEWTLIAGKLIKNGFSKFIDGDHSKFGPRLDPIDSRDFCRTINDWYRLHDKNNPNVEKECAIRSVLIAESYQAYHLVGNLVYQTLCGMPSGFPGTTEWNCASNSKWMRRAWLECWHDDPSMANFVAFRQHVSLYTYGDDVVMGVSDTAATRFNGVYLRDFFRKYDMKFTDAAKGDSIDPYKDLSQISFLKHKWVPHPTRPAMYLAQIEEQSVHECYRWIHDDGLVVDESSKVLPTLQNCEMSLYLAYGHGEEFYSKLRTVFVNWYRDCVQNNSSLPQPRFYTWTELDDIIWPKDVSDSSSAQEFRERYEEYLGDAVILGLEP